MSFELTAAEQNRVKYVALLGFTLDPIGHADRTLIIVLSSIYGVNLLFVLFMLYNRRYPPIKCKSPLLMAAVFFGCCCWLVGDLQINGHVHLANTPLTNCKLWGVWLRVILGVCTVSSLIALRSYGLYRVFRLNRPYRGLAMYLPFLVYCVCTLVYGIVAQVLKPSVTVEYIPLIDVCYCPKPFRGALYGYIWATWVFVAVINWKIRRIKSSFNESREMLFSCLVVFAILTFSTALQLRNPEYLFSLKLRILSTAMDHLGTNLVWWAIMGVPLFNCLFRRKAYLKYWSNKLRKDGLQNEYDVKESQSLRSFDTQDDLFFGDWDGPAAPEYLPNGEPRPQSSKGKNGRTFAPYRQSYQVPPKSSIRLYTRQRKIDPADPFDIPPLSPTTAVNSPESRDPFKRFSDNFRPLQQQLQYQPRPKPRRQSLYMANESQTVLPKVALSNSSASFVPPTDPAIPHRWSASSSKK
ncbi:hypothetical protein LPJ73_002229 [Coemansia sp. RSA 2703]|nr:hypothetical protein LPJ73_002229 [Coemansia sp. RSA 2703]KAJ2377672.1 hypothetical protein IW150_001247 [Coemansia sp. RSA 2607]